MKQAKPQPKFGNSVQGFLIFCKFCLYMLLKAPKALPLIMKLRDEMSADRAERSGDLRLNHSNIHELIQDCW